MFDAFYTPPDLAESMVAAVPKSLQPKIIADFAAGEGILLSSALKIWPNARILANDMATNSAKNLKMNFPAWEVSCSDFLYRKSYSRARYHSEINNVDLILINPPFSERGRKLMECSIEGQYFSSGTAVMFLFNALMYLKAGGCLLALLPNSCLKSLRDEKIWNQIRLKFLVEILHVNKKNAFKGVTASTSLIRIRKTSKVISAPEATAPLETSEFNVVVHRGVVQMHDQKRRTVGKKYPLIHTTNLQKGSVLVRSTSKVRCNRVFSGPGVLFPRVGRITHDKICVLAVRQDLVLSDCVLAVACDSVTKAKQIRRAILAHWEDFEEAYSSTGAPYITVQRAAAVIKNFLLTISTSEPARVKASN